MTLEKTLKKKYNINEENAKEIIELVNKYKTDKEKKKINIISCI